MKITFDPRAADDLLAQLTYLVSKDAPTAARQLDARVTSFLETFLVRHPRAGKYVAKARLWETWIPGTRLILWYRFTDSELQVVRVWHAAQNR